MVPPLTSSVYVWHLTSMIHQHLTNITLLVLLNQHLPTSSYILHVLIVLVIFDIRDGSKTLGVSLERQMVKETSNLPIPCQSQSSNLCLLR